MSAISCCEMTSETKLRILSLEVEGRARSAATVNKRVSPRRYKDRKKSLYLLYWAMLCPGSVRSQ